MSTRREFLQCAGLALHAIPLFNLFDAGSDEFPSDELRPKTDEYRFAEATDDELRSWWESFCAGKYRWLLSPGPKAEIVALTQSFPLFNAPSAMLTSYLSGCELGDELGYLDTLHPTESPRRLMRPYLAHIGIAPSCAGAATTSWSLENAHLDVELGSSVGAGGCFIALRPTTMRHGTPFQPDDRLGACVQQFITQVQTHRRGTPLLIHLSGAPAAKGYSIAPYAAVFRSVHAERLAKLVS